MKLNTKDSAIQVRLPVPCLLHKFMHLFCISQLSILWLDNVSTTPNMGSWTSGCYALRCRSMMFCYDLLTVCCSIFSILGLQAAECHVA